MNIDPLADHPKQFDQSPYQFSWNNPILLNDPTGEFPCPQCPSFFAGLAVKAQNWWNNVSGASQRLVSGTSGNVPREVPMSREERAIHKLGGTSQDVTIVTNAVSDFGHGSLEALGLAPVIGEVFDGINALWYAAEGDYTNASLSGVSMIPIIGDGIGKGGKALNYSVKATNFSSVLKTSDDFIETTLKFSDDTPDFELLGQLKADGNNLTIALGGYFKGVTNDDAVGLLGKTNIADITNTLLEYGKQNGFENVTLTFQRTKNSTSKNKGHVFTRTFKVNE